MASLAAHFTAFLFLFPTGLRRLISSTSLYLKNPSLYRSKSFYFSNPNYKNLDLYILCVALPIASFSEFFLFLSFSGHPTYRFSFFQQSFSLFIFWLLFILFVSRNQNLGPFVIIDDGFLFVFGAISFLVEYSVIGKGIVGVGGVVYDLLGKLTLVCAGCCLVLSVKPTSSFWADFVLCCGLVFKGTWILQAGLNLYTDVFGFKGCHKITVLPSQENAGVMCDLEEDGLRGVALVNLLFVVHAIGVLVLGFVVFGLLSYRNLRSGDASGPLLAELDSEGMLMPATNVDFEME